MAQYTRHIVCLFQLSAPHSIWCYHLSVPVLTRCAALCAMLCLVLCDAELYAAVESWESFEFSALPVCTPWQQDSSAKKTSVIRATTSTVSATSSSSTSSSSSVSSSTSPNSPSTTNATRRGTISAEWRTDLRALADSLGVPRPAPAKARSTTGISGTAFWGRGYEHRAEYDTAAPLFLDRVRMRETMFNSSLAPDHLLPLDEYLFMRQNTVRERLRDSILYFYDFNRKSKFELSSILKQAGVSIPLPPNPLTNIFGADPKIRLNVNLELNVRAGWRWDAQNLVSTSSLGQIQSSPVFNQNVQANVSASIGDKFNINLDQNTLRQFEFDNLTRIGFDGDADDIVKRVEFGNVQLNSKSTFINGSQSLFGARTDLQFGPLYISMVASQRRGQRKSVSVKGGSVKQFFSLRAYDYADNHFFLDTAYKAIYRTFTATAPQVPTGPGIDNLRIKEIEVWESTVDLRDIQAVNAVAVDTLSPQVFGGAFNTAPYLQLPIIAGVTERGRFKKLEASKFVFDQNLGTIAIPNLRRDRTYAVAYRIEGATTLPTDDRTIGMLTGASNTSSDGSLQGISGAPPVGAGTVTGALDSNAVLVLKLVYRPNMQPGFTNLWRRMMQNVYFIGARNVDVKNTKIEMWYFRANNDSTDVLEGFTDKIPTIFGVDRFNNGSGAVPPDGLVDLSQGITFNPATGELVFPNLEPFREGLANYFNRQGRPDAAATYMFSAVYDTTRDVARLNAQKDRFVITGEVSGQAGDRISLNAFNLSPGSVKVRLNGQNLEENVDFRVEYFSGQVQLLKPEALLPTANVEVEYEQNDIFQVANKNLLGLRADLDMKSILRSRTVDMNFGLTAMNYSISFPNINRVRLGEEPTANTMVGLDGKMTLNADWLTKALDALPFYDTKAGSSITASGEVAAVFSQPNRVLSTTESDRDSRGNALPVVYIDDFEGAIRPIPLGMQFENWRYCSPPRDAVVSGNLPFGDPRNDIASVNYRGYFNWYQRIQGETSEQEVFPNRPRLPGDRNMRRTLFLNFDPDVRGIYNPNPNFLDSATFLRNPQLLRNPMPGDTAANREYRRRLTLPPGDPDALFSRIPTNRDRIWGGFMRLLSSFNTNFDNDNIEYLEITMSINDWEPGKTKMYVDFGQIGEDVIPNGRLDTEDGILPVNRIPNGIIAAGEEGEDVGIDGLNNSQETTSATYSALVRNEVDPARDDFFVNADLFNTANAAALLDSNFARINGLEGNRTFQGGSFPDSEIQNRNNGQIIALDNSFFRYEINLDPNPASNPQIVNVTTNPKQSWITYRIPIRDPRAYVRFGTAQFANIQYVRTWFRGGRFKGQIFDWRLVGSQWQRYPALRPDGSADETLRIGFVSSQENAGSPDFYTSPPGVIPAQAVTDIANQTNNSILQNEQAMAMVITGLNSSTERMVTRFFRTFDVFFYKQLKFFLHGDNAMPPVFSANEKRKMGSSPAVGFVRFGVDSLNYYEYRVPLQRGWQEVAIDMESLTAIKNRRVDSLSQFRVLTNLNADSTAEVAILGNPTLTRLQFISFGVRNVGNQPLTTTMWVNELRTVEPNVGQGLAWAGVGNVVVKLADLGSVSASFSHTAPNFHRLEERFGNRVQQEALTVNAQFALDKFFPESWYGTSLPLTYSYSRNMQSPQFVPQNDVSVQSVAEVRSEGIQNPVQSVQDSLRNAERTRLTEQAQTLVIEESIALAGAKIGIPSQFFLFKEFLNRLVWTMNYGQRFERSPVVAERFRWGWLFNLTYTNTLVFDPIQPFGWAKDVPVLQAFKDYRLYWLPSNIAFAVNTARNRTTEQSRFLSIPSPVIQNFESSRQMKFTWKVSENGLLNPTVDYAVETFSTLVPLERNAANEQRADADIFRDIFFGNGRLNLGSNTRHGQNVNILFRPKIPIFLGGQFLSINGSVGSQYAWEDQLRRDLPEGLSKGATYQANIRASADIRWKELGTALFGNIRSLNLQIGGQSTVWGTPKDNSAGLVPEPNIGEKIASVIKTIFFDWDRISVTFSQQTSALNPGILGNETGFMNFSGNPDFGPSLEYQLGLVQNPHDRFRFGTSNTFPFVNASTVLGRRPPNAAMQDNYRYNRTIEIRTQRQLWEGATIDLTWKLQEESTRNQTIRTGADGVVNPANITNLNELITLNRSFLSIPILNSLTDVQTLLRQDSVRSQDPRFRDSVTGEFRTTDFNLAVLKNANSVLQRGLESLPFFNTLFGAILPRVNWAFRWDGLEKLPLLSTVVRRASLEHRYSGSYSSTSRKTDFGEVPDKQDVQISFEPLVGINAQFDDQAVDGLMNASLRYNTKTRYGLAASSQILVASEVSNDISAQWSYTKRGFVFPKVFGIELPPNDLEFACTFSYKYALRTTVNLLDLASTPRRLDGTTNIAFEPSARYAISRQVTARAFFRYEANLTEGAASPGSSVTQFGVDFRIALSGGRNF